MSYLFSTIYLISHLFMSVWTSEYLFHCFIIQYFILLLKWFWLWPLRAMSGWRLCPFNMPPSLELPQPWVLQDSPGSSFIIPAPALESITSPRSWIEVLNRRSGQFRTLHFHPGEEKRVRKEAGRNLGKPSIQGLSREGFIRDVRVHSESDVREAMKRHPHRASYLILLPYLTISSSRQIALLPWVNQILNSEESAVNITKTNKFSQPMDFSPSSLLLKCFSLLSQPEFHSSQSRASCTFSAYIYHLLYTNTMALISPVNWCLDYIL